MISKAKLKYIHSLQYKKGREANSTFVAEGPKVVGDLLVSFQPELLVATTKWLKQASNQQLINKYLHEKANVIEVSREELNKASILQHPQDVLCTFKQRSTIAYTHIHNQLVLALDGVQDPGNLGTIIRIADWFGISTIICSEDTTDVYNPKVIQATMGSLAHVQVIYTSLPNYINSLPNDTPIYGTLLDGNDIYQQALSNNGLIIMGNEGKGISAVVRDLINKPLLIPNFSNQVHKAESLNVAVATAIICSEFKRRK